MKKLFKLGLVLATVASLTTGTFAATGENPNIIPYWDYMDSIEVSVNFSGSEGCATATITRVFGVTTLLEATMTVYRQVGSSWVYVDSVSDSSTRTLGMDLYFDAISGATYKAVLDVTAHGSGGSESDSVSKISTCPSQY